jgi:O-antigen ligase
VTLARLQRAFTAAAAASAFVSIFAAQLALALAVAVYVARLLRHETRLERLPVDGPLLAFAVWTLLSASFSPDPVASHRSAKQLVIFTAFYLGADSMVDERARERVTAAMLLGGVCLAAATVLQFHALHFDTLDNRPHGFIGHYMTASGLTMATLVISAARLAFQRLDRPQPQDWRALLGLGVVLSAWAALQAVDIAAVEASRLCVAAIVGGAVWLATARGPWPGPSTATLLAAVALPLSAWALLVSRTRNAWLGALTGLAVVLVMRAPRTLWVLPAAVAAILVVRPAPVWDRLTVTDASSRDRFYMWQAGVDMIKDKPVFGQGPGMILAVYPSYRWPEAPNPRAPHLHDNALQVAAERGLPCLVWWLWWMSSVLADGWRETRRGAQGAGWVAVASIACLAAMLAAGLFEYNFGDSEVLMVMVLAASLPYALRRGRALPA